MNTEPRNTNQQIPAEPPTQAQPHPGVGGRHQEPPPASQGGGYQTICNVSGGPLSAKAAAAGDPRLRELRGMGMHPLWIIAAAEIGWDNFVRLWEAFSANTDMLDGRNRITLPSIETYRRFLRNEAIRDMLRAGAGPEAICETLREVHGHAPPLPALKRLMGKIGNENRDHLCPGQLGEPG